MCAISITTNVRCHKKVRQDVQSENLLILTKHVILVMMLSLTVKARIGKKRVLVIPKAIAENLSLDEGSAVKITVAGDKIIIEPLRDAVWLSLHGEKVARITLKELEEESIEQQRTYPKE